MAQRIIRTGGQGGGGTSNVEILNDLLDVNSPILAGNRYLRFDPNTQMWESTLVDFVESINTLRGNVLLTTNEIPETANRRYFNRSRLLSELSLSNLDIFADVEYDNGLFSNDVLTWDINKGKWTPRPVGLNLNLDNLTDVFINYDAQFPFYSTIIPVQIIEKTSTIFNEATQEFEIRENVNTGLNRFDQSWVLAWQGGGTVNGANNNWTFRTYRNLMSRVMLEDLQNVQGSFAGATHGQALMWDDNIYRWRPGGIVEIRSSDDIPEGVNNLYFRDRYLGDLEQVDDSIRNMTNISHPSSKVLGWNPATELFELVNALTDAITTANVPEQNFNGIDPPRFHTDARVYFSADRVRKSLGILYNGEIEWFGNVNHQYGKSHGQSLIWNATIGQWQAGNPTSAVNTDGLPEGTNNLYYTNLRVYYWARSNIQPTINYFDDVNYNRSEVLNGQSLVWDDDKWVNGYPIPLPINEKGDLVVGIGGNPYNYQKISIGTENQILTVDYTAPNYVAWKDKAPLYKAELALPDIPRFRFVNAGDTADLFVYYGTLFNTNTLINYINPVTNGFLNIYQEDTPTTSIDFLTDKIYYSIEDSTPPGSIVSYNSLAELVSLKDSPLIIDFLTENSVRLEELQFQANITGDFKLKISCSNDELNWEEIGEVTLGVRLSNTDFEGPNVQVVNISQSLQNRYFYYIKTDLFARNFILDDIDSSKFRRYLKLEISETIEDGTFDLYELQLYGFYNNNTKEHIVTKPDLDKFLLSSLDGLEFVLPSTDFELNKHEIEPGFQCWLVADSGHTLKVFGANSLRVINQVNDNDRATLANPIVLAPNSTTKLVYIGKFQEATGIAPNIGYVWIHKWGLSTSTRGSGGDGGSSDLSYALNRANHIGTQSATTIVGLHSVATNGSYLSLTNRPLLSNVATSGNYSDLLNRPTLGTASSKDTGTQVGQILIFDENNKLPALDASLLFNLPTGSGGGSFDSPLTTKGDLLVHDGVNDLRLPLGLDGFVLIADSTQPSGVRWGGVGEAGSNASTLNGQLPSFYLDRANHTGQISSAFIVGLHSVATSGNYNGLSNLPLLGNSSSKDAGVLANQVLLLAENNKLPALDGSLLTNVGSPLTTKGDLVVRATGVTVRLGVGTTGQILTVDPNEPTGLKWTNPEASSNAGLLDSQPGSYYLNRANHTGQIPSSSVLGLSTVATTGVYNDLLNKPSLSEVATTGSYNDLTDRPLLGTATQFNVGTSAFNVVQLNNLGKIPPTLLGDSFSPTVNKGDLIVRGTTNDINLPVGINDDILIADSSTDSGLRWTSIESLDIATSLPTTQKGEIIVHDGTDNIALAPDDDGYILSIDAATTSGLKWLNPLNLNGAGLSTAFFNTANISPDPNKICLVDTTSGASIATLPLNPPDGSKLIFVDFAGNFSTNSLTLTPSVGNTIRGESSYVLDRDKASVQLVFWQNQWLIYGTTTEETPTNLGDFDANGNGIIDLAEKINGIDTASNDSYYGKDATGNIGFHQITVINGGSF